MRPLTMLPLDRLLTLLPLLPSEGGMSSLRPRGGEGCRSIALASGDDGANPSPSASSSIESEKHRCRRSSSMSFNDDASALNASPPLHSSSGTLRSGVSAVESSSSSSNSSASLAAPLEAPAEECSPPPPPFRGPFSWPLR